MTTSLNLREAKTQLFKLVDRAAAGEEIVIVARRLPQSLVRP
jgi:antitoxin (DNA-binding transcriptional repressor) of toxin-antitoxin stability system